MFPDRVYECQAGCGRHAPAGQVAEPHDVPGTGRRCVAVVIWHRNFMPDDVCDGDVRYRSENRDVTVMDFDEWSDDVDAQCVMLLDSEGITEYSASDFQEHDSAWYSHADGSEILDHYTGERQERTAHLHGFTLDERRKVWERVNLL